MKITYETIDGKWWEFHNGEKFKEITDNVAALVIWGGDIPKCGDCGMPVQRITPTIGNYCDDCWMENHIFCVPRIHI